MGAFGLGSLTSLVTDVVAAPLTLLAGATGGAAPVAAIAAPVGAVAAAAPSGPLDILADVVGSVVATPIGLLAGAGALIEGVAGIPGALLGGDAAAAAAPMPGTGGNGRVHTRTIVQTVDNFTGQVLKQKIMMGSPHIMNSEIQAAKKVFRQSAKLHARMPRRPVKQSANAQLTEAVLDRAKRNVMGGDSCPPTKC